jgi:hypothetical protein
MDRFKDSADSAAIKSPVFFFEVPVVSGRGLPSFPGRILVFLGLSRCSFGQTSAWLRGSWCPVFATEGTHRLPDVVSDDPTVPDTGLIP